MKLQKWKYNFYTLEEEVTGSVSLYADTLSSTITKHKELVFGYEYLLERKINGNDMLFVGLKDHENSYNQ